MIQTIFAITISEVNTSQDVIEKIPFIMAQTMRDSCKREQPLLSEKLDEAYKKGSVQLTLASQDAQVNGVKLSQFPNYHQQLPEVQKQQFQAMISNVADSVKKADSLKICTAFINDLNQLDAETLKKESIEKYKQYKQRQQKSE